MSEHSANSRRPTTPTRPARPLPEAEKVQSLIRWLKSLHGGEAATFALIGFGRAAVPALREVLYERDPSGIYEPRCRAVKALAAIGAQEVLLDFLAAPHEEADPVARLGEETVISATARALLGLHSEDFYRLLERITQKQLLPGVVEALAAFRRPESIPVLLAGLAEDFSRPAAEEGLVRLGAVAREPLIHAATTPEPSAEWESPSSLRRRRSALQLLHELGIGSPDWTRLRILIGDKDPMVTFFACRLCLGIGEDADQPRALERLLATLPGSDWFVAGEIEDCLVHNFSKARQFVEKTLRQISTEPKDEKTLRLFRTLQRVKARAAITM
jgi:hypothetical protein